MSNRKTKDFPPCLVWNPWIPLRVTLFFLGSYVGKDFDTRLAQKKVAETAK